MTAQQLTTRPLPAWAQQASLGIFIHWGPYSVPAWAEPTGAWGEVSPETWFAHCAYAEWYANTIRVEGSPAALHHRQAHGGVPYTRFLDQWTASEYDPRSWARLFREMGADYVIPVTKHHDGVVLWDAPGSSDNSTMFRGPEQDLLTPLAEAVRAEGMRFGVYYSGGLDWAVTDFPPIVSMEDVDRLRPRGAAYAAYATAHVRDLIDRFAPSVIWNDIDWPDTGKDDGSLVRLLDHYYETVPDGIVNDRWGCDVADYRTSEYAHDTDNEQGIGWEHNRGLGLSFGFSRIEDEELTLSPRELARVYADVVSRGGRLLLNIGPDEAGRIPELQERTLRGVAGWMRDLTARTNDRRPLTAAERDALGLGDDARGWARAWISEGALVIVAEDEDLLSRLLTASASPEASFHRGAAGVVLPD